MAFDISWLIDKRVVYMRMYGNIEIDDIKKQTELFRQYRDQGISPVHIVVDARHIAKIPMSPDKIKQMGIKADVDGHKVILTNSAITRYVASLVTQLMGLDYRFLETPEAALHYLYQLEPALEQLEVNHVILPQ